MHILNLTHIEQINQGVSVVCAISKTCPPCMVFKPIFNELNELYKGRAQFMLYDKVEQLNIPRADIKTVPALLFIIDGQTIHQASAPRNKDNASELIRRWLEA